MYLENQTAVASSGIGKFWTYLFGLFVALYLIGQAVGDLVALGMTPSLLLRTVFGILFLIPLGIVWRGYVFALEQARAQETRGKAWKYFLLYAIAFFVIAYVIGYILGIVLGLLA